MRSSRSRFAFASVLGVLALLIAACGTSTSGTGNTTPTKYDFSYKYETPPSNAGSTIVFADHQKVDSINPILLTSTTDLDNANAIFNSCLVQLPDLTLGVDGFKADQCKEVPSVANGDEAADGTSTTMKLDPKAVWSDGTPITADDYLFYANVYFDPNIGGQAGVFQFMKSVERVDDLTVKITWNAPYAAYLYALWGPLPAHSFPKYYDVTAHKYLINPTFSATDTKAQDLSAAAIADPAFNLNWPTSNGAFTVKSVSTDTITYAKNPKFFSNFFHPTSASTLVFRNAGDVNTEIESFKTGAYDHATNFQIADTANFAGIPQAQQIIAPQIGYEHIDFNLRDSAGNAKAKANGTGHSIFAGDKGQLVRKAFIEAFDICGAFTTVLNKSCKDPNLYTAENTAPPAPDYDSSVTLPAFNAAQAKADLAAAGYPGGVYPSGGRISLTFLTSANNPVRQAMVNYAASNWNKNLGVNVNIIQSSDIFQPFTANKQNSLTQGNQDIALFAYVNGSEVVGNMLAFQSTQIPSAANPNGGNDSGVNDPHIDSVLTQAASTLDTTARNALAKDLQKYITGQNYNLPLYIRANYTLDVSTLHNLKLYPTSTGDTWNIADWFTTASRSA